MIRAGRVQDIPDLVDLGSSPLGVHGTGIFSNGGEDREQTESNNGLLVENVKFAGDGGNRNTGS